MAFTRLRSARVQAGRYLARVPHRVGTVAGVLVLLGTLTLAALVPGKELAVALAVVGTFTGTALLTRSRAILTHLGSQSAAEARLSATRLEHQLRASEQKAASADAKAFEAAREVARLERMRISLASLSPIQKLGLLEVETNLTDVQHRVIAERKGRFWSRSGYRKAFLGVVQIPIKAHLGVDLQSVQVREAPDGSLVVSGLKMISIVDTVGGATWLLDEIRTEILANGQVIRAKCHAHDSSAKLYSREQELQLRARLSQGQDFKVFESGLVRTAEQFLRVLLAPLGKEIVFEMEPRADGRGLMAYLAESNHQLEQRLAELRADIASPPQLPG